MKPERFRKMLLRNRRLQRDGRRSAFATRLIFESLEERRMLATIDWSGADDGTTWNDGANWVGGQVPGSGDDAVINTSGSTIVFNTTVPATIASLTVGSNDSLSITGGSLTLDGPGNSTISGGLSMTGGSLTVSGTGVTLTANGATTVSDATLEASSGGTLDLPNLTTYSISSGTQTLEATGTGSVLSLTSLTGISVPGILGGDNGGGGFLGSGGNSGAVAPSTPFGTADTESITPSAIQPDLGGGGGGGGGPPPASIRNYLATCGRLDQFIVSGPDRHRPSGVGQRRHRK